MGASVLPAVRRRTSAVTGSSSRQHRLAAQLPTTGLLLLTILIGAMAIGASQHALPHHLAMHGLAEDTVLLQSRVDDVPTGARWSGLMVATLEPGASWTLDQAGYEDLGAMLFRVEAGALTVRAKGAIDVVPAGASQPRTVGADTDVVLHAGDGAFSSPGVVVAWRNDGSGLARVLLVELAVVGYDTHTVLPPGVTRRPLIEQRGSLEPISPALVILRRVTLPSQATLPLDAVPGLELLYIVSGELTALDPRPGSGPINPLLPPAAAGQRISKGTSAMGTFRPGRVVSNPGAETTTLLMLTITAAEPAD